MSESDSTKTVPPGLVYVTDSAPGYRRVAAGGGFEFVGPDGRRVDDADVVRRIESLRIPPAWTDVWICDDAQGHLQVTGRDARGRKQYLYHPDWRRVRDEDKYGRMVAFGECLTSIRARVEADLSGRGLTRTRLTAAVVRLLDETLARIGNAEYRRANESFGLTTLRDEHATVGRERVRLAFRGKSGKWHEVEVRDRRLARVVQRSRDLTGQELFQYVDESGAVRTIGSSDVNEYLYEICGERFTSKDFRTWGGTAAVCAALRSVPGRPSQRAVASAVRDAAEALGNTPAVCRRSYVHPGVIDAYLEGTLCALWDEAAACATLACEALKEEERILLELLKRLDRHGDTATRSAGPR